MTSQTNRTDEVRMTRQFSDITVRRSGKHGCGIVEMLAEKCVVGYWEVRKVDGEDFPEFRVVHDRLGSCEFDRVVFWEAIKWGQKLAEVFVGV